MKRIIGLTVVGMLVFLCGANVSYAALYDYGDATGYGAARHVTNEWQQLGTTWTVESGSLPVDSSDDGVWWSTDGGNTWGHDTIYAGQDVTFRFDMIRAPYGRHEYDQLKAWVDWNGDRQWDNEDEIIIAEQWFKNTDAEGNRIANTTPVSWNTGNPNPYNTKIDDDYYKKYVATHNGVGPNPNAELTRSYVVTMTVPDDVFIGELWLRARVSCDHTAFANTNPYGELWQGEVEDWAIHTAQTPPVPEPGTVALLGLGLLGLIGFSRKYTRK